MILHCWLYVNCIVFIVISSCYFSVMILLIGSHVGSQSVRTADVIGLLTYRLTYVQLNVRNAISTLVKRRIEGEAYRS